jgi:hypothetical protein
MLVEFAISVAIWAGIIIYVMCGFVSAQRVLDEEYENIDDDIR